MEVCHRKDKLMPKYYLIFDILLVLVCMAFVFSSFSDKMMNSNTTLG